MSTAQQQVKPLLLWWKPHIGASHDTYHTSCFFCRVNGRTIFFVLVLCVISPTTRSMHIMLMVVGLLVVVDVHNVWNADRVFLPSRLNWRWIMRLNNGSGYWWPCRGICFPLFFCFLLPPPLPLRTASRTQCCFARGIFIYGVYIYILRAGGRVRRMQSVGRTCPLKFCFVVCVMSDSYVHC